MHCFGSRRLQQDLPDSANKPTLRSLEPGWEQLLTNPSAVVSVACSGRDVVGSVVVASDNTVPSGLVLCRLYVDPQRWGQSIGSMLRDTALDNARAHSPARINLWVLEHNVRARKMYERRGWLYVPGPVMSNAVPDVFDVLYELDLSDIVIPRRCGCVIDHGQHRTSPREATFGARSVDEARSDGGRLSG
jgi:GNAT superfamily N-acetyltransferase